MASFKNILAIESAMSGAGVAVIVGDREVVRTDERPRGQAEYLMPMVQGVMDEAGLGFGALEAIVTSVGPGAFTGLRIGLAASKALALALDIPVYGITSLQALALSVQQEVDSEFVALVETRRDDFYMQRFDQDGKALGEPAAMEVDEIEAVVDEGVVLVGDAVARFQEMASGRYERVIEMKMPDPALMARGRLHTPAFYSEGAEALYLRGADVSASKKTYRMLASS